MPQALSPAPATGVCRPASTPPGIGPAEVGVDVSSVGLLLSDGGADVGGVDDGGVDDGGVDDGGVDDGGVEEPPVHSVPLIVNSELASEPVYSTVATAVAGVSNAPSVTKNCIAPLPLPFPFTAPLVEVAGVPFVYVTSSVPLMN